MAGDGQEQRTDEELLALDEDAASAAVREAMKVLCVSGPGIVQSFDRINQTVSVQPAIKKKFTSLGVVDAPVCVDVPVCFPAGGGLIMTFPVQPGDECWLVFADRAIDNWWENGGTQLPSELRFHDPSDCVAFVGVSSKARALGTEINGDALEIRTRDGAVIFRAVAASGGGGGGGSGPVEAAVLSDKLLDAIAALTVPTGMGPSGTPINIQQFKDTIKSKTAFVGP